MIPMIVMTDRNAGRTAPSCRPAEREGLMTQEKAGCGKSARPVWASLRRVEWIPTDTAKYWLARPSQLDHGFGNFARLLGTQLIAAVLTLGAFISKQGLLQYSAAQFAAVANFRSHDGKITNLLAAGHDVRNRTEEAGTGSSPRMGGVPSRSGGCGVACPIHRTRPAVASLHIVTGETSMLQVIRALPHQHRPIS